MALNFSHRPIFPTHLSEDNLVSPLRIANGYVVEGVPEKNGDGFFKQWHSSQREVVEDRFDRGDRCGSQEAVSKDIIDLLPSDPFGMDISSTFTAITGWLEDLEVDYGVYGGDEVGKSDGNYQLFAGLNFIWNNAMRLQAFNGNVGFEFDRKSDVVGVFGREGLEKEIGDSYCHGGFGSACNMDEILSFGNGSMRHEELDVPVQPNAEFLDEKGIYSDQDGGAPHAAFSFAVGYLGVRDLLLVEKVCKSLHSTIQNDPLLWRSIHIEQPLNEKITDDALLQLTSKAQGNLQCLSLVECPRITDDGLKHMLENNRRLTKLSVPGCTRLSIEGIISNLKNSQSLGAQGLKHLRIGGLYGVTQEHFEELKLLLGTNFHMEQGTRKPHFYHRGNLYLPCEDDRPIDIETCPRCEKLRLVYDCPFEDCQGKEHPTKICRACTLCISRCVQCGRCINDSEYEETFCLELLCSDCWKQQLLKCQERQDRKIDLSEIPALHESSCSFSLNG